MEIKYVCLLLIMAFLMGVLTGCGNTSSASPEASEKSGMTGEADVVEDGETLQNANREGNMTADKTEGNPAENKKISGMEMVFLNVGKADAILINVEGCAILVDAGEDDDYMTIKQAMEDRGIVSIDHFIITHFDKDHIGSAAWILRSFPVKNVYMPQYEAENSDYRELMAALRDKKDSTQTRYLTENETIAIPSGEIFIDAPDENSYKEENNYSLITEVKYNDYDALLLGDALKKRLSEYMEYKDVQSGDFDLIKLPHHGDLYKKLVQLMEYNETGTMIISSDLESGRIDKNMDETLKSYNLEYYYTFQGDIQVNVEPSGETQIRVLE